MVVSLLYPLPLAMLHIFLYLVERAHVAKSSFPYSTISGSRTLQETKYAEIARQRSLWNETIRAEPLLEKLCRMRLRTPTLFTSLYNILQVRT
jgi:hypothetical protein